MRDILRGIYYVNTKDAIKQAEDAIRLMPPLVHWDKKGEFDASSSEVGEWMVSQPWANLLARQVLFSWAQRKGLIRYNAADARWSGAPAKENAAPEDEPVGAWKSSWPPVTDVMTCLGEAEIVTMGRWRERLAKVSKKKIGHWQMCHIAAHLVKLGIVSREGRTGYLLKSPVAPPDPETIEVDV